MMTKEWVRRAVLALSFGASACGKSSSGVGEGSSETDGGSRGTGGDSNGTSDLVVEQLRQTTLDKLDLLFVIDNSPSMADKQTLLSTAVPRLLERFTHPMASPVCPAPSMTSARSNNWRGPTAICA